MWNIKMNSIIGDDVIMDPVSNWLKKHNELNDQLRMKMKVEPVMKFSNGGLLSNLVAPDPSYSGGFLKFSNGGLLDKLTIPFYNMSKPLPFEDGGVVNPILNLVNMAKTASDLGDKDSELGGQVRDVIRGMIRQRNKSKNPNFGNTPKPDFSKIGEVFGGKF